MWRIKPKQTTQCGVKYQEFFWPDGLRVDVDGSDALQQELDHLQEGVGGLFGECQLPSDLPLHTVQTVIPLIPTFMDLCLYICICIYMKTCNGTSGTIFHSGHIIVSYPTNCNSNTSGGHIHLLFIWSVQTSRSKHPHHERLPHHHHEDKNKNRGCMICFLMANHWLHLENTDELFSVCNTASLFLWTTT